MINFQIRTIEQDIREQLNKNEFHFNFERYNQKIISVAREEIYKIITRSLFNQSNLLQINSVEKIKDKIQLPSGEKIKKYCWSLYTYFFIYNQQLKSECLHKNFNQEHLGNVINRFTSLLIKYLFEKALTEAINKIRQGNRADLFINYPIIKRESSVINLKQFCEVIFKTRYNIINEINFLVFWNNKKLDNRFMHCLLNQISELMINNNEETKIIRIIKNSYSPLMIDNSKGNPLKFIKDNNPSDAEFSDSDED